MRADFKLQPMRSRFVYSIADTVYANVLGSGDFDVDTFPDLIAKPKKIASPQKDTILHDLIREIESFYNDYSLRKFPEESVEVYSEFLSEADMRIPKWLNKNQIRHHMDKMYELMAEATEILVPSVFYVLFSDRQFVMKFTARVSQYVSTLRLEDHPEILARDGQLKRPTYLPRWLKAGVFYRDRGRCQHCSCDLSGLGRPVDDLHLDHIIPLRAHGSNDPTNFQLLCAECNLLKGRAPLNLPSKFAPYW